MSVKAPQNIWRPVLLERDRLTYAIAEAINHTFLAADAGCAIRPGEVDRLVHRHLHIRTIGLRHDDK